MERKQKEASKIIYMYTGVGFFLEIGITTMQENSSDSFLYNFWTNIYSSPSALNKFALLLPYCQRVLKLKRNCTMNWSFGIEMLRTEITGMVRLQNQSYRWSITKILFQKFQSLNYFLHVTSISTYPNENRDTKFISAPFHHQTKNLWNMFK